MQNPVGWFEIYVNDLARAQAFYEQVFALTLSRLDSPGLEMLAFPGDPAQEGAAGALVRMPGFAAGGNSTLVYFRCQDCATEAARAVAAGGRVQKSKTAIGPYGFIALVVDTEGNMIGLHSMH
jgi:predicted enzyme related to lactoylglutathione lyase